MKTRFNIFLMVFTILTMMSIASCTKEVLPQQENIVQEKDKKGEPDNPSKPSDDNKKEDYKEFSMSLSSAIDTLVFPVSEASLSFTVEAQHADKMQASVTSVSGAKADVSFDCAASSGVVTFTPEAENGSVVLTFTDGTTTKSCTVTFSTYYLKVNDAPTAFGEGEPFEATFTVDTNLPNENVTVTASDWISAILDGNTVKVELGANDTYDKRNGIITVSEQEGKLASVTVTVTQGWTIPTKDGCVVFRDGAFLKAMVAAADADGDGYVSFAEAESVKEIDITSKGIKDITGLDAFKNVWKFDARDNDIVDADILKELHFLYWLDLRGNKNLRTFDLTGCSMHFDHCEFELTDELQYKVVRRQVGAATYCKDINEGTFASVGSDPKCEHAVFIDDPEVTKDWSVQNTVHLLRSHTAGYGKTKVVFTGLGYTDRDIKDGTFGRIMTKAAELFQEEFAGTEFLANVDVLYMDRIIDCHDKWKMKMYDSSTFWMKNAYKEETSNTLSETYGAVTGVAPEDWMCANQNVLIVLVDIIPNLQNGFSVMSARASYKYCSYDNPNCQVARFVLTKDRYYNEGKDNEPYAYTWRIEDCYLNGCFESFVKSCNF